MPIPDFGLGNVLPPFLANDVVGAFAPRSPYLATMSELVTRFATSPERATILRGLISFREELRNLGFSTGFQWIDGSFVEHCEVVKGRPPNDIDVVSVVRRPDVHAEDAAWAQFVAQYGDTLFDQAHCKAAFRCDAYFIDLDIPPEFVSRQTAYWFGLFSHQRDTFRWKGMVQVEFECDDDAASVALEEIEAQW